jgi:3-isopropylmalate/(R)-2-methylmalate dehydratase small subunit
MSARELTYRGTAWVYPDNVAIDGDLMPLEWALKRETDPQVLKEHTFSGLDPDFPKRAKPGDVVVGGRRFAQGNPHIQGMIGLVGCGVGLVAESIPIGSFRNALAAGLPVLPRCPGVRALFQSGEGIEVDFTTGVVRNTSTGREARFTPLPPPLLEMIRAGGWGPMFRRRLDAMAPQGVAAG